MKGFQIETDAKDAISLIKGNTNDVRHLSNLVLDCRSLMVEIQVQTIANINREGNDCADALASMERSREDEEFNVFCYPPIVLRHLHRYYYPFCFSVYK
ncbi:hypothetical protein RHMOL_Rhmol07G0017400 [Rhododendron molle]|uniref:Uncharacterized protein n=1 Tax=Rhododendron molle TaxID=49168 RepID=A0ACC0MW33_RHOML|nr:hypothetical protein RHMOL_Rhmol07G0017400 [Rhododendron molle]